MSSFNPSTMVIMGCCTTHMQVDLHGMLVEEALAELEQHVECLGGIAYRAPEGIALSVITGRQPRTREQLTDCRAHLHAAGADQSVTCSASGHCISPCSLNSGWSAMQQRCPTLHRASPSPELLQNLRRHAPAFTPGKGNHSVGGRPRIRPAVVRWLTEAGHRFAATADTGGIVVQVMLAGDSHGPSPPQCSGLSTARRSAASARGMCAARGQCTAASGCDLSVYHLVDAHAAPARIPFSRTCRSTQLSRPRPKAL